MKSPFLTDQNVRLIFVDFLLVLDEDEYDPSECSEGVSDDSGSVESKLTLAGDLNLR